MIVIHAKYGSGPAWHRRYANALVDGFKSHGHVAEVTEDDCVLVSAEHAVHVIFGPNYFPQAFKKALLAGNALTINRCFYGDANDNVAIGWNGFNGLADFPAPIEGRYEKEIVRMPAREWRQPLKDHIAVILGEYASPCDDKLAIKNFYIEAVEHAKADGLLPIFRPHPLAKHKIEGAAFAPSADIRTAQRVYTHASTYGVHARLIGCPVWASPASLAHCDGDETESEWRARVASAQWHIDEITSGAFWEHLADA